MRLTSLLALAANLSPLLTSAHPGHDITKEAAERRAFLDAVPLPKRSLAHCAAKLKERGIEARNIQRRADLATSLQQKQGLPIRKPRDLATALATSHLASEETIFASNASCLLSPEVTEGPYYVAGEYVRKDITDNGPGVAMSTDLQVLDYNTCEPVSGAYVEIWSCNSTGVYGGIVASGNGNSADQSNWDKTFLRGAQQTNTEGVVQFDTLFPGHYTGRTTHIHIMVHASATARPNGTLFDTTASHVGQIFFDQDLIYSVEATPVYAANRQTLTTNAQDGILAQESASGHDPFVSYALVGSTVADGLITWIGFGIDTTLGRSVSAAAYLYEEGGQSSGNSGGGPGGPPMKE